MSEATYWRGVTNYGTGFDMMARIEELEAENTRLKLALGQIQRRESPDAGRPWRFDEHAGYGENNRPLPPMEGRE